MRTTKLWRLVRALAEGLSAAEIGCWMRRESEMSGLERSAQPDPVEDRGHPTARPERDILHRMP